jgi:hypothetical protein
MSRFNNVHTDYYYKQFFEKVNKFLGEFSMYLLVFPGFEVIRMPPPSPFGCLGQNKKATDCSVAF